MKRNDKNFIAGLMFFFIGISAMIIARDYPLGTTFRMGPGYFPTVIGGCLAILGLASAMIALWVPGGKVEPWAPRPLLLTLGSILAFGIILERYGLVLAALTLVGLGCAGGEEFRIREAAILGLLLTLIVVGIFVYGLGLTFRVWPI